MYRSLVKAALVLLPVLGLTWVFGLLAINEDTIVFVWIFTVLNSLQASYTYIHVYITRNICWFVYYRECLLCFYISAEMTRYVKALILV